MNYQQLCKKYPGKEIRLIMAKDEETYKGFGFTTIQYGTQESEVNSKYNVDYCFMIEA